MTSSISRISHKPDDPKNLPDETSSSDEAASGSVLVPSEALHFADQSSFAKSQLEHVVERLQNKMQALKVNTRFYLGVVHK
jgi:hypothetical protein